MNDLYEVLEICLQELEQGRDIETVLFSYPDLADELRPILEVSVNAKKMAAPAPSAEIVQRNRAKVLQHAAQMREANVQPARRIWFTSLRRLVVTLAVLVLLFASGTGLVRAASTTLPGDNLYPVKRTWEDVLVAFTFNVQQRDLLEVEHENERLQEVEELFAEGRSAKVDFAGSVTSKNGTNWVVSGVAVVLTGQTEIRDQGQGIVVGSAVRVKGQTQGNNLVLAERIDLLPAGSKLPEVPDEPELEQENHEGSNQPNEDNSGKGSEGETLTVEPTQTVGSESESKVESLNGTVNSMSNEETGSSSNDSSNNNTGSNSNSHDDGSNHDSTNDSGGGGSNSGSDGSGGGGND